MFTGIIEHLGTVDSLKVLDEEGGRLTIHAPTVTPHLAIANSIAVDGCCLTVVADDGERFSADLSAETIRKTSIGEWKAWHAREPGTAHDRWQGIWRTFRAGPCRYHRPGRRGSNAEGENWWYGVEVPESFAKYIVPQGSIAIDGISLTVARWNGRMAEIAIIPFTYEHTNIKARKSVTP